MTDNAAAGPAPQAASTMTLENYRFPSHRLLRQQRTPDRTPLVLVACGSFSPITYLHLRMFEMANDYARINTQYEVVGGYLSPVSDAYKKAGLAEAHHRYANNNSILTHLSTVPNLIAYSTGAIDVLTFGVI